MGLNYGCSSYYKSIYGFSALSLSLLGWASLVTALFSPYWLVSKPEKESNFVRLGLWSVCFREYRHPSLQYDDIFDGCYSLYSHKSEGIRNWLQTGWFTSVQSLTTASGVISSICISLLMFICLSSQKEKHIFISASVFALESLAALLSFLAACVFGAMCFERSWIQHPKRNFLSWGYLVLLASIVLQSCASSCLLLHTFKMRKLLHRDRREVIMQNIPFLQ